MWQNMLSKSVSLLNKEKHRIKTFRYWKFEATNKNLLAQIGFYYIGPEDLVKCYFCKVEIGTWQPEDNPVEEHLKWSPNCPLLHRRETTNEPLDADALKRILPIIDYDTCGTRSVTHLSRLRETHTHEHPEFALESHRLASYKDWPISMKQRPEELAEAGFYYTGRGDWVACFSCGGGLKDWKELDVPWEEHAMWYNKCEYLKLMKGQKFIDEISPPSSSKDTVCVAVSQLVNLRLKDKEEKSIISLDESRMCKICCECEYNTVFFPCGHIIACVKCATSVMKCPYCRQSFTSIKRIYFP